MTYNVAAVTLPLKKKFKRNRISLIFFQGGPIVKCWGAPPLHNPRPTVRLIFVCRPNAVAFSGNPLSSSLSPLNSLGWVRSRGMLMRSSPRDSHFPGPGTYKTNLTNPHRCAGTNSDVLTSA